jgi:hypothetical protein
VVGDHPWLRPHPPASAEGAFRARALALLARASVSVRAVFGRMYASAPHVGVGGLSQSEAVCLPTAHLPRLLLGGSRCTHTAAAAIPMMREAGVTVSLSVGGRWVEVVGEVGEMPMSSIVDAVRLTRAESGLLHIHVLDGCAIRHCTSAGTGVGAADASGCFFGVLLWGAPAGARANGRGGAAPRHPGISRSQPGDHRHRRRSANRGQNTHKFYRSLLNTHKFYRSCR